ncbi:MAG: PQQ-dependent sugar dehydrogenase [Panacibacter sp.]
MGILSSAQPQISFNSIAQNLAKPVSVANAGDGSGRLFIVEQDGLIKIFKNGNVLSKPFLDISSLIKSAREYKGLFSIAFPADYNIRRTFFVFYTNKEGASVLARFKASKANPDSAVFSSAVEVLSFSSTVGNGPHFGDLQFGADGYLYVMLSDVSKPGLHNDFAQDGQSLLGKILRINVHVANAPYYKIPQDNPFVNNPSIRDEIWSLGIRNAWHWSFDRQTGDSWIADVGEDNLEEVNFTSPAQAKGANYGWHCFEGNDNYNTSGCGDRSNYVFPVFAYPHNTTNGGFAVIGGYVYRGNAYPALNGYYICADYTTGNAWKIKPNASGNVDVSMQNDAPKTLTGFGESEDGELYAVSLSGNLYRVQPGSSVTAAMQDDAVTANKNTQSFVYPTLVDNSTVTLDLKEVFQTARLMDMQGHEIMRKTLNGQTGKVTMNFPRLQAGMYIVQLIGALTIQQKIYITK